MTITGLALTVAAAVSPGYWWFVVIFAFGRPLLSATNVLAEVMAAEETVLSTERPPSRSSRPGYAAGAGLSAIVHSLAAGALGFRGIFALASSRSPSCRAARLGRGAQPVHGGGGQRGTTHPGTGCGRSPLSRTGAHPGARRLRHLVITGPANSFMFLYAQDVVHLAGYVTALMVVAAGVAGGLGLLAGRWLGDHDRPATDVQPRPWWPSP